MSAAVAGIDVKRVREALGSRSIVLVGLMGAGKSSIGRRLAHRLGLPFVDADTEIEKAADLTIPEIFEKHGEAYFRAGEVRVVARILDAGPQVLATGGGAYINPATRDRIRERGVAVWLKAELDVLMKRVKRRGDRPLLKADDPRAVLQRLMDERYPVYAEADVTVVSREASHEEVVDDVLAALAEHVQLTAERGAP
ncbi:MAG: shikimate kinase [Phreatobacter sp.]|nr:shikimate kinase [Phreatobacter sp.]